MVNFYKHYIPAWMDGTENLSDGAYRALHVICQLIYLHEGSIALNERGIAGRCRQSVRAFRKNLNELVAAGKLTIEDGRLHNSRANLQLEEIEFNRMNAKKGGQKSGESRKVKANPLQNHMWDEASLQDMRSLKDKTRQEETRPDQDTRTAPLYQGIVKAFERVNSPIIPDASRVDLWLRQGYEPEIILATVSAGLRKKPSIRSLNYFDNALHEAHETRLPKNRTAAAIDWDPIVTAYKITGNWPRSAPGSEPDMDGCQVPPDTLRKHGYLGASSRSAPAKIDGYSSSKSERLVEPQAPQDPLWPPIDRALTEHLGPELLQGRFAKAKVVLLSGEQIIIAGPSQEAIDEWERLFRSYLFDAVRRAYPQVTDMSLVVAPASAAEMREQAA